MTLTIPQGGIAAGRAAQLAPAPVSEFGEAIANAGSRVAETYGAIRAQQQEVQTQRTQLDITRDLGAARQQFDQMTDPAQIEAEWPGVVQGLQDKYLNATGPDGQPLLTPDQQQSLGLFLRDISQRHGLALGERAITLTQSQRAAAWIETSAAITTEAATADPDTLFAMIELGEAAIDQQLRDGVLMPEQAATEKAAFRMSIYNARATEAVNADPAAFLAAADAGEYNDLGAERIASLKVAAEAEIARRAAAAIKQDEAALAEQNRVIGDRLTTMTALFGKPGVTVADLDYLNLPEVQAHPDYPAAIAARDLAIEIPGLRQMTVAQLDAQIAAEEAAPKSETYQTERLTVLRTYRDAAATGYATDAVATAQAANLPVPPIDLENLDTLATSLSQRMTYASTLQSGGYVRDPRSAVISEAERTALKTMSGPDTDLDTRMQLATSIALGTGGNSTYLTRIIGTDPVFAEATRIMAEGGSRDLAASMLRGHQAVAAKTAAVPSQADQIAIFDAATGGVFDGDPLVKAQIMAATEALYADGSRGLNPDGEQSVIPFMDDTARQDAYTAALQRVTGATPDANGALTVGGIQPVRDSMVRLPPGTAVSDVDAALEGVEDQLRGYALNAEYGRSGPATSFMSPEDAAKVDPLRGLRAASIDGRVPFLGTDDAESMADVMASLQIELVPGRRDQYRFVQFQNGRPQVVTDADGLEYRFRMDALIRGASQ